MIEHMLSEYYHVKKKTITTATATGVSTSLPRLTTLLTPTTTKTDDEDDEDEDDDDDDDEHDVCLATLVIGSFIPNGNVVKMGRRSQNGYITLFSRLMLLHEPSCE